MIPGLCLNIQTSTKKEKNVKYENKIDNKYNKTYGFQEMIFFKFEFIDR